MFNENGHFYHSYIIYLHVTVSSSIYMEEHPYGFVTEPTKPVSTWWFIPLTKWVITPVGNGLTLLIPVISGVITLG